jgi:hypothetical protein
MESPADASSATYWEGGRGAPHDRGFLESNISSNNICDGIIYKNTKDRC